MTKFKVFSYAILLVALAPLLTSCYVKPHRITTKERDKRVQHDWAAMFRHPEEKKQKLTIYKAMARAIKYNLDVRVKMVEQAYAMADLKYVSSTMLPSLMASGGYYQRNNAYSVISPTDPSVISTTQDKTIYNADLQFSWNVLDFGVSYYESKQKADLYLISLQRKRKMMQQVLRDVRYAYWRAWAAQDMIHRLNHFIPEIRRAINNSNKVSQEKLVPSKKAAKFQAELWDTLRKMNELQYRLSKAKPELLALISEHPSVSIKLSDKGMMENPLPMQFPKSINKLEIIALHDRPELREEDLRSRISLNEIKKARLKMFPNLELNLGGHYDSNSFLVNNLWADVGVQTGLDLLRTITTYQGVKVAKAQHKLAATRRLALSMAVIAQVNIAKLRFNQSKKELMIVKNLKNNRKRYYRDLQNERTAKLAHEFQVVQNKAKYLEAQLRYYLAYAEWQNSAGQLMDSVGYYPIDAVDYKHMTVDQLAVRIQNALSLLPKGAQRYYKQMPLLSDKIFLSAKKQKRMVNITAISKNSKPTIGAQTEIKTKTKTATVQMKLPAIKQTILTKANPVLPAPRKCAALESHPLKNNSEWNKNAEKKT